MEIKIKKCDLCKIEYRSDESRHWSDVIDRVIFDFSHHAGIQGKREKDVCTGCGKKLENVLMEEMERLINR